MLIRSIWRTLCLYLFLQIITPTIESTFIQNDIEYDGQLSVSLQHALDDEPEPTFTNRGSIVVQSIRTGIVQINQVPLTPEERRKLKNLKENNGIYRLRSIVTTLVGRKSSFLTFVKGCALYESRLSDSLTLSLDHAGNPIAVSMAAIPGICEGNTLAEKYLQNFNTTVFVRHMEQGPIPDTAAFIQKLEREKEARDRGETKDNRGFFAKYWMYIVPVAFFVLLSSAANPEGAAGGGGRR